MAMCQTRHTGLIECAMSRAANVPTIFGDDPRASTADPSARSKDQWLQAHLHNVGFHRQDSSLRRLCPDVLYHLQFPDDFREPESLPRWLRVHPTWKLPGPVQTLLFGGRSRASCSLCGGALHRLLVLDPVPPGLGISRRTRLEFATCLSCLGWERRSLFYRHDDDGFPLNIGYDGPPVRPEFPCGPLREAEISLAHTPRRWFWQAWGCSNSRENLSRIGGEPCWIQDAEYPTCPQCESTMCSLFQLDSNLPTADGGELLWGSGGIAYAFWCDGCQVSGLLWQCT